MEKETRINKRYIICDVAEANWGKSETLVEAVSLLSQLVAPVTLPKRNSVTKPKETVMTSFGSKTSASTTKSLQQPQLWEKREEQTLRLSRNW